MSGAEWDLGALFNGGRELQNFTEQTKVRALNFNKTYKDKLKNLSESEFNACVREYESISQMLGRVISYASLKFAQDSNNGVFYAKYQNIYASLSEYLIFFELEFNKLSLKTQKTFIASSGKYAYFLEELAKEKPHQLSLNTESVLLKKEQTGGSAFARLFDEHFSNLKFAYKGKKLSEEQILSLLHDKDRNTRKSAAAAFTKELKKHQKLLSFIFNMIRRDLKTECEIRDYKSAEEHRHDDNKISQKSVDALICAVQENFGLSHEYYDKKRQILGFDKLYDYDRYAPLDDTQENFSYEKSQKIVLDTFEAFSPIFADIARQAFRENWIDAYPKPSKRGGAFSHSATADTHPYVFLNHTDQRRDLFTLAHELGHAIHQYLSRNVGYLLSDTPLTTAETASVFAEMLVFDEMKKSADKKTKRAMLSSKLEDIFATLYRQINFTTFERAVHAKEDELSLEEFNKIWIEESRKMFGKSVELTKNYEIWWSYIPHFIHTPFYCYAYAYGQLLVLALFGLYKNDKTGGFKEKYIEFLSAGGSKSPKELVSIFGFNIEDEKFWQTGIHEVRKLVNEFKEL
ncbi:MAG: M3 family oligoendopeptidase [Campylobacteraceae bacterium]|nr:M3 family oligoendopeptidase [Campylobacteraceae bacterium]